MPPKRNPPTSNPSCKLGLELNNRGKNFRSPPLPLAPPYIFNPNLPEKCAEAESESHLRYVKYQPFDGSDSFGTKQEFEYLADAKIHLKNQNSYDPNYLIHSNDSVKHNDKHQLIFSRIIRDFNGWINEHAKGKVSPKDMLNILKNIGKNLRYLCTEAKPKQRPHGKLSKGVGITPELETLFYNLCQADHDGLYSDDIKDLHEFLKKISLQDPLIKVQVERWKKFLSDTCTQVEPEFKPVEASEIHPPYYSASHVRMIVNYPSSWDVDEQFGFLAKVHELCKRANLLINGDFENHLVSCYPDWNDCFTSLTTTGTTTGLNEVYQYGVRQGNYVDKTTGKLCVPTIAIFAHSYVKHYQERAQDYNILHRCENVTDPGHMNPYLPPDEILADLEKQFPNLIENIYQAYYKAVAKGYKHPQRAGKTSPSCLGIEEILPKVVEGN